MKCELCDRDKLDAKELSMHRRHFHRVGYTTSASKEAIQQPAAIATTNTACPDCGGQMIYEEGCVHCTGCGYSKCG